MSTPGTPEARLAAEAAQDTWAAGKVAPSGSPMADTWEGLRGGLPSHQAEVMASHDGRPTIAVQDRRNGAGLPSVDHGDSPPHPRG